MSRIFGTVCPSDAAHEIGDLIPCILVTPEDRHACFQLRHDAYVFTGTIEPQASGLFTDQFDERSGCILLGLKDPSERLVGSVRLGIETPWTTKTGPEFEVFHDIVEPFQHGGQIVASGARLSLLPGYSNLRKLLLSILLLHAVAANRAGAHWCIASASGQFTKIYKRLLGMEPVSDYRRMPCLNSPMQLCVVDFVKEYPQRRKRWDPHIVQSFGLHETRFLEDLDKVIRNSGVHGSCSQHVISRRGNVEF